MDNCRTFPSLHFLRSDLKQESRYVILAVLQNAYVYAWPKNDSWEGMVVFRRDNPPLHFSAKDEQSAKAEGLRLAGHEDAFWKNSRLPMGW